MKTRIQKLVMTLFLALALAGGIVVGTGAVAFASTGTSASAGTQRTSVSLPMTAKAQNASSSCATYLVPQLQWETYLEAVSVSNHSLIYWFQTQPIYGQLDRVNIWRSTNGGRTATFLGTYQPPVSGPGIYVFYRNNIPFVTLCGYSVYSVG
jgi:hypothetical protein